MIKFLKNRFKFVKSIFNFCLYFINIFYKFIKLISSFFGKKPTSNLYKFFTKKYISDNIVSFIKSDKFVVLDIISAYFFFKKYKHTDDLKFFRYYYRIHTSKYGFYLNIVHKFNKINFIETLKLSIYNGMLYIYYGLRL